MQEKTYLKWYNKVGYGSGDIAGNVVYAFLSSFVMIYLTNTVGLHPGVVGSLIAASKLFDGVTDILISLNKNDIIQPVELLSRGDLKENGQWNQVYLDNSRIIKSFISGQYGAKYYIVGINILVGADCRITTTSVVLNDTTLAKKISQVDQEQLKRTVVMLDPVYVEGGKSTMSSDYVVPAVRGILDSRRNIIGYTILYFDYGIIESMFAENLPDGSLFQVTNQNGRPVFSNCGEIRLEEQIRGQEHAAGNRKLGSSELETALGIAMQNVAAGADPLTELQTVQATADSL